jgi:hypothetical protein
VARAAAVLFHLQHQRMKCLPGRRFEFPRHQVRQPAETKKRTGSIISSLISQRDGIR